MKRHVSTLALAVAGLWTSAPAAAQGADVPVPYRGTHCTTTLLDQPVRTPAFPAALQARLDQDLRIAEAALAIAPDREDHHIWLGRRLSYLGRLCAAIDAFSRGIARFPESYRLRRFRGQTLTRVRAFDLAVRDFERAAALDAGATDSFEPDGAPNAQNLALGTYRSNIFYYLAQTRFATGDYRGLVADMERSIAAMPAHILPEHLIPTTFWRYLALRKAGDNAAAQQLLAALPDDIRPVEAAQYYEAVRLLRGQVREEALTMPRDSIVRFAVAMKHRFDGDEAGARQRLAALIADTPNGYWPAEVELAAPDRGRAR
jgi:tetratricopeptide (TPR) repeat protein